MDHASSRPRVRFAHLTDLHFTTLAQRRYPDVMGVWAQAIADLNAQDLDFVLITGDLFHYPERLAEELPVMRGLLDELRHPYYVAFGNHDVEGYHVAARKERLMQQLGDRGLALGSPYYAVSPVPGLRLIVLDSTDTPEPHYLTWRGRFGEAQAAWLSQTLEASRDELTLLAIHHPPITPYPLMGSLKFEDEDRARLGAALAPHAHARVMLCGHYHLSSSSRFGPATVLTGPSVVEHPHHYRVVEIVPGPTGHALHFHWHQVMGRLACDAACRVGTAMRHVALNRLSYARRGQLVLSR